MQVGRMGRAWEEKVARACGVQQQGPQEEEEEEEEEGGGWDSAVRPIMTRKPSYLYTKNWARSSIGRAAETEGGHQQLARRQGPEQAVLIIILQLPRRPPPFYSGPLPFASASAMGVRGGTAQS
ncbi:unnamed protein product [Prorocentrum cordatum]|uniref:Uncharacterized protein n=1 Tax=Prorocentrum cordatum TaxID=2364126 RepID=A0ABN9YJP9_9DINO|nr:unnamed protein product [Polarella glacialis]